MELIKEKVCIGVLMGGPSAEHDVSLKSGGGVVASLKRLGWEVSPIIVPKDISLKQAEEFVRSGILSCESDVVFIALHGTFGEDGAVQAICEDLKVAYTGSGPLASQLGMDKIASRIQFEQAGIYVPKWAVVQNSKAHIIEETLRSIGFPVVVKPASQGSSIGVSLASHHAQLIEAIDEAARYDPKILLEEFIQGREMTVGILDQEALPVVEIKSKHQFFDFTAKYTPGETSYIVPAVIDAGLSEKIKDAAIRSHRAIGCRHFSRVDIILDGSQRPVVLEINTIPGLTPTSLLPKAASCIGMSYDALCERFILMAVHERPRLLKSFRQLRPAKAYA